MTDGQIGPKTLEETVLMQSGQIHDLMLVIDVLEKRLTTLEWRAGIARPPEPGWWWDGSVWIQWQW